MTAPVSRRVSILRDIDLGSIDRWHTFEINAACLEVFARSVEAVLRPVHIDQQGQQTWIGRLVIRTVSGLVSGLVSRSILALRR